MAMTFSELQAALDEKNVAIVHFSHYSNMRPGGVFPTDMIDAIENRHVWPLSCIALWPNHQMHLIGYVGVIFVPTSTDNILSVCSDDSGSSVDVDGNSRSAGRDLSAESIEDSFKCLPGRYNEWVVKGAEVKGIFVANPHFIKVKKLLTISHPELPESWSEIMATDIDLTEVFDSFPGQSIFTMGANGLVEIPRP